MTKRVLGRRGIEQIAFKIGDRGAGDQRRIDVGGRKSDAGAEVGGHGALRVGGDQDQTTRGGNRATGERCRGEKYAGGLDVMAEYAAELIVSDLAEKRHPGAENGRDRTAVADRTAAAFDPRPHRVIDRNRLGRVDQRHPTLGQTQPGKIRVARRRHDIDDGQHIKSSRRHDKPKPLKRGG